ncbi:MAG: glycosyltransferase family 4 protein [Blastocatellia bacterium]|nr:glycosyltransferase family 4 protein [Blastocatellia bacterium]
MSQTPRVLLSAYQCGPGMGSVSQIGWEWYDRLNRRTPTTLVTHIRNRDTLTQAGVRALTHDVIYIDTEWFAGPLYRFAKRLFPRSEHAVFLLSSLDFFVYDRAARKHIRKLLKTDHRWDVVHAVTPVSPVAATGLHKLGLPLIFGPLNGGLGMPPHFGDILQQDSGWLYRLREVGRIGDFLLGTTRRAARILTATKATLELIPAACHPRCVSMIENGIELSRFTQAPWPPVPNSTQPLQVVFVGRLIPVKGVAMLLEAVAQVRQEFPIRCTIVGDGPMRGEWEARSQALGLAEEVRFVGNRTLDEVAEWMRWGHVFCLPSVRESGGAVLLEAMASARPVVALAFGGPAEIVRDDFGCAIEPLGSSHVVNQFARIFREIVAQPEVWRAKGETARQAAAARFDWNAKVEAALEIYRQVLTETGSGAKN